jgi:hypothetical protein
MKRSSKGQYLLICKPIKLPHTNISSLCPCERQKRKRDDAFVDVVIGGLLGKRGGGGGGGGGERCWNGYVGVGQST